MSALSDEFAARDLMRPAEAARALGIDYETFRAHAVGGHFPSESFAWGEGVKVGYPREAILALAARMQAVGN